MLAEHRPPRQRDARPSNRKRRPFTAGLSWPIYVAGLKNGAQVVTFPRQRWTGAEYPREPAGRGCASRRLVFTIWDWLERMISAVCRRVLLLDGNRTMTEELNNC